jgi:hypothetical protein
MIELRVARSLYNGHSSVRDSPAAPFLEAVAAFDK